MPTDAPSNHSMLLLVMNYLAAMVWQVGTASLVVLLVHPNLVELVIVQLVHLHLLNLATRVNRRWPAAYLHHLDATNLLACILTPIQARQLVSLILRVTLIVYRCVFAGGYISSCNRCQLLRGVLLGGHLLLVDHGLYGALRLPWRVKNPLVVRNITREGLRIIHSLHLNSRLL